MGPHNSQSLCVHLDLFSIYNLSNETTWWHPREYPHELKGPSQNWTNIPTVVCVTLVIPYKAVSLFSDLTKGNATPLCQLQLQSSISMIQSTNPDIQLCFGRVKGIGKIFTDIYILNVHKDAHCWLGNSALIVSAMVSIGCLVKYGDIVAKVEFALKKTPRALQ